MRVVTQGWKCNHNKLTGDEENNNSKCQEKKEAKQSSLYK